LGTDQHADEFLFDWGDASNIAILSASGLADRLRHPPYACPIFAEVRMPDYRRYRVPGGTYFFTVNLLEQRLDTLVRHVDALREAVRATKRERPFHIDAWGGSARSYAYGLDAATGR
jgi:hypothetical protein